MLEYRGRFPSFDFSRIRLYDLATRPAKVLAEHLSDPASVLAAPPTFDSPELRALADAARRARAEDRPVVVFTGAHLIKNGFGPLLADLLRRDAVTLVAINFAGAIHDLELALVGRTSEDVPRALPKGEFGFARETGTLLNGALTRGEALRIGAGEAIGRLLDGEPFPDAIDFPHRRLSLLHAAHALGKPVTVHASIGTDIVDQYPSFDPSAKGGCSGRDFAIFCAAVERLAGGVFVNVGSAIMGPEVFLKACSMCANVGSPPTGLTTAAFDIRDARPEDAADERTQGYYQRDLKSVVVRIPEAFGGRGLYVKGDHLVTVPALYRALAGEPSS